MPPPSRLPQVGDAFGRYRIDAQIGRGGMGVVFRATDPVIDRTVALKVISSALGDAGEFRLRFEREAAVLARLASPHVIAIFDYGTHDDCPYIATQFIGGGDLGALLHERGPMPPALALQVCAQMADALHDAHRVGVVHRDVKPTNVLLRDADSLDPHAYLCDFGVARTATDGLTAPGAVAGTWSYLAPECGRGAPGTPSSDIYALGCLLWATLSGSPPYRGSDVEVAVAHQRAPIPQLEGTDELSSRINTILRHTMAKDPHNRYGDAEALRVELVAATVAAVATASSGSGIRTPSVSTDPGLAPTARPGSAPYPSSGSLAPPSTPRSAGPTRPRSRLAVALAGVAVLSVVGVIVGVTALTRDGGGTPAAAGSSGSTAATTDPTTGPTTSPTTSPTTEPTEPVRVDQGGPITSDLDGDGLGDLRIDYALTSRTDDHSGDFSDITAWRSDGATLVQGDTAADQTHRAYYDQAVTGDFDGDDVLETLTSRTRNSDRTTGLLTGDLSGGATIDTSYDKLATVAFLAAGDLDGDGSDDLRLLYVDDIDKPGRLASVILDGNRTRTTAPLPIDAPAYGDSDYTAGDYDGDGLTDLATLERVSTGSDLSDYYSELALWFNDGAEGLRRGPTVKVPGAEYTATILSPDLDGDEDQEVIVVGGASTGEITGYDLDGRSLGRAEQLGTFRNLGQASVCAVSDVDGDGLDDVVAVAVLRDDSARLLVARSDGESVVVSRWGTWKRTFDSAAVGTALFAEDGPFS